MVSIAVEIELLLVRDTVSAFCIKILPALPSPEMVADIVPLLDILSRGLVIYIVPALPCEPGNT